MEVQSCPVCGGPWEKPKDVYIVNDQVYFNGERINLSRAAHQVFAFLLRHQDTVALKDGIWGYLYDSRPDGGPDPKIINVYMVQVRKTINSLGLPFTLKTVWGVGWEFRRRKNVS